MSKEFAASPPYFDFSELDPTTRARNMKEVTDWIKNRMPECSRSNDNVFSLFYACVASIGYHKKFMLNNLHSRNPLRNNIFITETMPHSESIVVKYPWNKTSDTPQITGLPPDILILAEFESVHQELKSLRTAIADSV